MRRPHSGWWSGLLVLVGVCASQADDATTSGLAKEVLEQVAETRGLLKVFTKTVRLEADPLSTLQLRRSLDPLEPARAAAAFDARVGGATLTTVTATGGSVRLDLVAFPSGSRARRYVDAVATAVWLVRGTVAAGAGEGAGRAGFSAATFGSTPKTGHVGRWGRWVAAAWADLPVSPGTAPPPRAFDVATLVESALATVAARDRAHEEPTVRNPWEDPAARADAYDDAVAAVESICRTKFRKRPAFRTPTPEELRASLARELRDGNPDLPEERISEEASRYAAGVIGLYMPSSHALYVVPHNLRGEAVGLEVGWLGEVMMRVVFAHELTHALDFERFDVRALQRAAAGDAKRIQAMWAVTEGHAQWVARKAALGWGIPEAFVTAQEMQGRTPDVATVYLAGRSTRVVREFFGYETGLTFFESVEAAKGLDGVDEVFARPPTTPEEIDRPGLWIEPSKARASDDDLEWLTNPIARAVPAPAQIAETITLKSGLRVHLAFLDAGEREGALDGFEGGHGFHALLEGGGVVNAGWMRFATEADAQRFLTVLRRVSEAKDRAFASGVDRFTDTAYADGVGEDGKQPGFRVSRTLVARDAKVAIETTTGRAGRTILEMTLVDVGASDLPALHKAYDEHLRLLAPVR